MLKYRSDLIKWQDPTGRLQSTWKIFLFLFLKSRGLWVTQGQHQQSSEHWLLFQIVTQELKRTWLSFTSREAGVDALTDLRCTHGCGISLCITGKRGSPGYNRMVSLEKWHQHCVPWLKILSLVKCAPTQQQDLTLNSRQWWLSQTQLILGLGLTNPLHWFLQNKNACACHRIQSNYNLGSFPPYYFICLEVGA